MKKLFIMLMAFSGFVSIVPVSLLSGPTVIQDNRITNLGATPVLGRGYSIATNTFQSICLQEVKVTEPSYDFTYSFQEMDEFLSTSGGEDSQLYKLANATFRNYLTKSEQQSTGRPTTASGTSTATQSVTTTEKRETKKIVVNIQLDSYYASVDESRSKLSDSAAKLVQNKDMPGFFSSCGPYYIRSIRRNALFISVFEFESISSSEDAQFTYKLETELKGFRKRTIATGQPDAAGNTADEEREETSEFTETEKADTTSTFTSEATQRNLTITAAAFGLGKNEKATLISYDIETFKTAIKDAFLSMQRRETGKVTSIEVVPWSENTEFQNLLELEKAMTRFLAVPAGGKAEDSKGETLHLYEKKFNLNQNAEFLAEIERSDRAMMNIYYKAKICRKYIDTNWKQFNGQTRVFKLVYTDRWVMNNRTNNSGVSLSQLDAVLTNEKINSLLSNRRQFMYGGGIWGKGASNCISTLLNIGIFRVNYRDIESCTTLEENLVQIEDEIIENHCMPILFNKGVTPSQKTVVAQ